MLYNSLKPSKNQKVQKVSNICMLVTTEESFCETFRKQEKKRFHLRHSKCTLSIFWSKKCVQNQSFHLRWLPNCDFLLLFFFFGMWKKSSPKFTTAIHVPFKIIHHFLQFVNLPSFICFKSQSMLPREPHIRWLSYKTNWWNLKPHFYLFAEAMKNLTLSKKVS